MDIELEILMLKNRLDRIEKLLNINNGIQTTLFDIPELPAKQSRDKTKYVFANKILPKNRLVLEIIKKYVDEHNPTFAELQSVFDKSLQGSLNVVETFENAQKIKDAEKRYFMKSPLLLKDGNKVVVCTQWGIFNIVKFEKLASNLGFVIDKI